MPTRSTITSVAPAASVLVMAGYAGLAKLIADELAAAGYSVRFARHRQQARSIAIRQQLDMAIVNVLPGYADVAWLGRIPTIEIAVCGTGHKPHGVILGPAPGNAERFDLGALRARVDAACTGRAHVAQDNGSDPLRVGDLVIERSRERASLAGAELPLTPTEYWLLRVLAERPGEVVARAELAQRARGRAAPGRRTCTHCTSRPPTCQAAQRCRCRPRPGPGARRGLSPRAA